MKNPNDPFRKFEDLEAARRLLIERGQVRVESDEERSKSDEARSEAIRKLLERKSAKRDLR